MLISALGCNSPRKPFQPVFSLERLRAIGEKYGEKIYQDTNDNLYPKELSFLTLKHVKKVKCGSLQ